MPKPSKAEDLIGQTLGSYRVIAPLGQGGMGTVYVVEHELLGKRAALKVLRHELSAHAELVDRFFNEARAAARIRHAGIVDVYDFGHAPDGSAYLVMELLQGRSLAHRMGLGPLDEPLVREILRQMASALQAAHNAGIIHRDLKPDNVFLVDDSSMPNGMRVKLLDFGIAKLGALPSEEDFGTAKATRTGVVMGTPAYMAPEQWKSASEVDARADLYSLGCVAYELLAGRPPFEADSVLDLLLLHRSSTPKPLASRASPALVALIDNLLEKDPRARPHSMHEVVDVLDGRPVQRDPTLLMIDGATLDPSALGPAASHAFALPPESSGSLRRTTLSDAARVLSTASARVAPTTRSWAWGVAAAVIVAGAGLTAIVRFVDQRASQVSAPLVLPAELGPPKVEPPKIHFAIDSRPQGANVYRAADSVLIGRTPLVEQLAQDGATSAYIVKHDGFLDERLAFAALRDTDTVVTLRAVAKASGTKHTPHAHAEPALAERAPVSPPPPVPVAPKKNGVLDPFAQ